MLKKNQLSRETQIPENVLILLLHTSEVKLSNTTQLYCGTTCQCIYRKKLFIYYIFFYLVQSTFAHIVSEASLRKPRRSNLSV